MQTIHAEAPRPVRADPSVVELASASRRPPISATRPHITRLGREHVAQLIARLCGLDKLARINRFGHPASNPCVQAYAKQVAAGAAYMAGAADAGLVEAFAACGGVADANWRRWGIGSAQLETATRWAERASVATLRMVISRDNWPMRHLAHKASARLDFDLDEILADIAVATATTPGANGARKPSAN